VFPVCPSSTRLDCAARPWAPPFYGHGAGWSTLSDSALLPERYIVVEDVVAGIKGMRRIGKMGSHNRNHLYVDIAGSLLSSRAGKLIRLLKLSTQLRTMSHAVTLILLMSRQRGRNRREQFVDGELRRPIHLSHNPRYISMRDPSRFEDSIAPDRCAVRDSGDLRR
jgi:hypothetical protein